MSQNQPLSDVKIPDKLREIISKYHGDDDAIRSEMAKYFPGVGYHVCEDKIDSYYGLGQDDHFRPREIPFGPRYPKNYGDTCSASDHPSVYLKYSDKGDLKSLAQLCAQNLPVFRNCNDSRALVSAYDACIKRSLQSDIVNLDEVHVLAGSVHDLCLICDVARKCRSNVSPKFKVFIYTSQDNHSFPDLGKLVERINKRCAKVTIRLVEVDCTISSYLDKYRELRSSLAQRSMIYSNCLMNHIYEYCDYHTFVEFNKKRACVEFHISPLANHGKGNDFLDYDSNYVSHTPLTNDEENYMHCSLVSDCKTHDWEDPIVSFSKLAEMVLPVVSTLQVYNNIKTTNSGRAYSGNIEAFLENYCIIVLNSNLIESLNKEAPKLAKPLRTEDVFGLSHKPTLYQEKLNGREVIFEMSGEGLFIKKPDGSDRFSIGGSGFQRPLTHSPLVGYGMEKFEVLAEMDYNASENNRFFDEVMYEMNFYSYVMNVARKISTVQVLTRNGIGVMFFQEPILRLNYTKIIQRKLRRSGAKFDKKIRSRNVHLSQSSDFVKRVEKFEEGSYLMDPMSYTTAYGSVNYVKRGYTDNIYHGIRTFNIIERTSAVSNKTQSCAETLRHNKRNHDLDVYVHDIGEYHIIQLTGHTYMEFTKNGGLERYKIRRTSNQAHSSAGDLASWQQIITQARNQSIDRGINVDSLSDQAIRNFELCVGIYMENGSASVFEDDLLYRMFKDKCVLKLRYDKNFSKALRVSRCLNWFRRVVAHQGGPKEVSFGPGDVNCTNFSDSNYLGEEMEGIRTIGNGGDEPNYHIELLGEPTERIPKDHFNKFIRDAFNAQDMDESKITKPPEFFPSPKLGPRNKIIARHGQFRISTTRELMSELDALADLYMYHNYCTDFREQLMIGEWVIAEHLANHVYGRNFVEKVKFIKESLRFGNMWLFNNRPLRA